MDTRKGSQLLVNLGASQARKRLKGFGHGVRKVQSIGRGQAMILHTASGEHLRELEQLFDDVGHATSEAELGVPVESVRNLGPQSAAWLREIGIVTTSDLKRFGAVAAYQLVKRKHPQVSKNLLWAIAAGLEGRDFRDLSASEKEQLLGEL